MARTTKADLEQLCRIIARHTDNDGWYIEYAYGRPRLLLETDPQTGAAREVSPRLPPRELALWMEGFIESFRQRGHNPGIITPHLPQDIVALVNPDGGERRILESFSQTTPESAEEGDFSETGMVDEEGVSMEPDDDDIEDGLSAVDLAVAHLKYHYVIQASSSAFHPGVWYSTDYETIDFGTATEEQKSHHLKGFTEEEEREIFNEMKAQRVI